MSHCFKFSVPYRPPPLALGRMAANSSLKCPFYPSYRWAPHVSPHYLALFRWVSAFSPSPLISLIFPTTPSSSAQSRGAWGSGRWSNPGRGRAWQWRRTDQRPSWIQGAPVGSRGLAGGSPRRASRKRRRSAGYISGGGSSRGYSAGYGGGAAGCCCWRGQAARHRAATAHLQAGPRSCRDRAQRPSHVRARRWPEQGLRRHGASGEGSRRRREA
jgi:hypothetical protein